MSPIAVQLRALLTRLYRVQREHGPVKILPPDANPKLAAAEVAVLDEWGGGGLLHGCRSGNATLRLHALLAEAPRLFDPKADVYHPTSAFRERFQHWNELSMRFDVNSSPLI